ncbi:MAG: tetratricopeptide repeat protein, partial [Candidatus Delongbacteria bacterium]|nr:tetratricopeptide repeat protein [Candidatus Delongbacteria bacterium]
MKFNQNLDKSVKEIENLLKKSIKEKNKNNEAISLIDLGELYFENKKYSFAEKNYIKALKIIKKENIKLKKPGLLKNLG